MLKQVPSIVSDDSMYMWRQLRHLDLLDFKYYWEKLQELGPLIDPVESYFDVWEVNGIQFLGMRHRETGEKHGVVREVVPEYGIIEASYKNGQVNGLQRHVYSDRALVCLIKDDTVLAEMYIDDQLQEFGRRGTHAHLLT